MIRRVLAQTRVELSLTLRRGESALVTIGIPVGVLAFFSTVEVFEGGLDFLVPGSLALAVIATGMVSLGIATGFERQAGVLKRLGVTPLGRGGLLAAKVLTTALLVALQAGVLLAVAVTLGWEPSGSAGRAAAALALGTMAFTAVGFALAGTLRAETNLAAANGLFLVLLLLGGIVVPVEDLPGPLEALAHVLPAEPLAASLRAALGEGTDKLGALGAWAVGAAVAAGALFRWD